jgi:superoxide dismutase, Cu-Zn family
MRLTRLSLLTVAAGAVVVTAAQVSALSAPAPGGAPAAAEPGHDGAPAGHAALFGFGTFAAPGGSNEVVAYDRQLVPEGASVAAFVSGGRGWTRTVLAVRGLVPGHRYSAHVHDKACGATGAAAGPHYQFRPDPVSPSVDPAFANPANEIWLVDRWGEAESWFEPDQSGSAFLLVASPAPLPADRLPGSVVLHADPTMAGPGHAGMAGSRIGCVTLR